LIINQEEANAVNVENSGLWCPALAGEGPQDCWQNNNCQENGHGRETDEKVIVPEQIALPRVFSIVFVIPSCSSIVQAKKKSASAVEAPLAHAIVHERAMMIVPQHLSIPMHSSKIALQT